MKRHNITRKLLYWTPRILCILFALFISLFALDVFGEGYTFGETILALLIHLVPTYIVIALLWLAWKLEWIGAIAFFCLGAYYLVSTRLRFDIGTYLVIISPLFLLSLLFLINWILRSKDQNKDAPIS